jgi:peptidoglycan hydrolase-like protein with peptidoglycan-binding domain
MARDELARQWRRGLMLAGLAALALPATADARYAVRTLHTGSHGRDVKILQKYLTRAGFRARADGAYGRRTRRAVRRFERAAHRHVDGRASRRDQRAVQRRARRTAVGSGGAKYAPAPTGPGDTATLSADGRTAIAPAAAPQQVKDVIAAANAITRKPYRYGGGHGRWHDSAYDCSGAVSYALHGGDLLSHPRDSSGLEDWGVGGPGAWITVYANAGHAYAVIAGLRFDTSGRGESGPRWRPESRSGKGYVARHPAGL